MSSDKLPKEFRNFIFARLFFVLGLRMITTIVIYQVFHLASTFMVGFAGLAEFVPAVIAALYAGHYIDKHNKKNILYNLLAKRYLSHCSGGFVCDKNAATQLLVFP
jgi:hypothetical protein